FIGLTIERLVATISWYEKQGHGTVAMLFIILIPLDMVAVSFSYLETFGTSETAPIVFTILTVLFSAGGIVYLVIIYYNVREVTKLSRRGA
ncbi:hypothetical protein PENTCL1PPCAC_17345, partial [Pristionchus entomophagus]